MSYEQRKAWTASLSSAVHTSSQTAERVAPGEGDDWLLVDTDTSEGAAEFEPSANCQEGRTQVTFSLKDDGGEQATEFRQDWQNNRPLTREEMPAHTTASCAAVGHHRKTVTFKNFKNDGGEQATELQQEQATEPQQEEQDDRPPPKQNYFRRTTALYAAVMDYHDAFGHLLEPEVSRDLQTLRKQWKHVDEELFARIHSDPRLSGAQFVSLAEEHGWRPEYGLECLSVTPQESKYLFKTLKSLEVVVATRHGDPSSRLAWTVSLNVEREKVEQMSRLDVVPYRPSIHGRPGLFPEKAVAPNHTSWMRYSQYDGPDGCSPTLSEICRERATADQHDDSPCANAPDTERSYVALGEVLVGALPSLYHHYWPQCTYKTCEYISRAWTADKGRQAASMLVRRGAAFVRGDEMECCHAASSTVDDTTEIYLVPTNRRQEFQWHLTVHSKTGETLQARREDLTC